MGKPFSIASELYINQHIRGLRGVMTTLRTNLAKVGLLKVNAKIDQRLPRILDTINQKMNQIRQNAASASVSVKGIGRGGTLRQTSTAFNTLSRSTSRWSDLVYHATMRYSAFLSVGLPKLQMRYTPAVG